MMGVARLWCFFSRKQGSRTIFGVLKKRPRYQMPSEDDHATVKVIMKIYHEFKETIAQLNIWRAFRALEFEFHLRTEPYRVLSKEEERRNSGRCEKQSSIDFSRTDLRVGDVLFSSVESTSHIETTSDNRLCQKSKHCDDYKFRW
jgi:hypothetical protein